MKTGSTAKTNLPGNRVITVFMAPLSWELTGAMKKYGGTHRHLHS
jgi:hypothetical protein